MRPGLADGTFGAGRELGGRRVVCWLKVARIGAVSAQICFFVHYVMDDFPVLFVFYARVEFLSAQSADDSISLLACHFYLQKT